jgi:hypothetical protein
MRIFALIFLLVYITHKVNFYNYRTNLWVYSNQGVQIIRDKRMTYQKGRSVPQLVFVGSGDLFAYAWIGFSHGPLRSIVALVNC